MELEGPVNRPNTNNKKLQNLYRELWRDEDTIPGGTMQMAKEEIKAGMKDGPHIIKAQQRFNGIKNILDQQGSSLSKLDHSKLIQIKVYLEKILAEAISKGLK